MSMACEGEIDTSATDPDTPELVTPSEWDPPSRESVGEATLPAGRRLRRMSADQFVASLEVATGQRWRDYERFAGAMGRADFAEITEEGTELNVTFEKLVEDAARATCDDAVAADVAGADPAVVLRHATVEDRDSAAYRENLRYLYLRFLAQKIESDEDPRLAPWLALLSAPADNEMLSDADLRRRWTAVCVGLVTHADFVAY